MAADKAYSRDQAKLRQQHSGGAADEEEDDLHIDVPQGLPEVNPEVFRDVEPLLFKGFVYAAASINDVPFVFKSLNHHEFEQLNMMGVDLRTVGRNVGHKAVLKQFNTFLAFGVLFFDGINVLSERGKYLSQIAEMFGEFNETIRRKVIYHLSEINRRANRAVLLTEAYAMEPQSRLRWAQYKGAGLMSPAVTGIAGTDALGMNWSQLMWRAINHFEDQKDAAEREWENAKFIASSMAGKGMQKVYTQDKQRRKHEREDRLERRDKILRFALLNEAPSDGSKVGAMVVARTVEELTTQLKRDLQGEKDWHDMVVDQMERRSKDDHKARMQAVRDRHASLAAEHGPRSVIGGTVAKEGLTPDEVKFRIDRRRQLAAQALAAQAALPELHDPKMAQFLDKWAKDQDDGSQVAPLSITPRLKALPIKRGDE